MRETRNKAKAWVGRYARPLEMLAATAVIAAALGGALHYATPAMSAAALAAWVVAAACATVAAAGYAMRRYRMRKADPYARLKLWREPRFDTPRMGPRAAALAVGEPVIRITPIPKKPAPGQWSLELLQALEWKRFGLLCSAYYGHRQFRVEAADCGDKRGTDARLYFKALRDPVAIVHCRAWGTRTVGVQPLRELLQAMEASKVPKGIFHAPSDYTNEAKAFAGAHRVQLVSGQQFVARLAELPEDVRRVVLELVTEGDYATPTCPACGRKMALHAPETGEVWACSGFPQCRATLHVQTSW